MHTMCILQKVAVVQVPVVETPLVKTAATLEPESRNPALTNTNIKENGWGAQL